MNFRSLLVNCGHVYDHILNLQKLQVNKFLTQTVEGYILKYTERVEEKGKGREKGRRRILLNEQVNHLSDNYNTYKIAFIA